jgi:son of sevenless-like protein
MKLWIETYCLDDAEDKEVLQLMKNFAVVTMSQDGSPLATQLQKLAERREISSGQIKKITPTHSQNYPPPILPRSLRHVKFLDLDPLEVARQLTIIEYKEFNKIQPHEFLQKAWSEKENNIKTMITMSNQVSGWVAQSILSEKEMKKRASLIKHFVNIADVSIIMYLRSQTNGI